MISNPAPDPKKSHNSAGSDSKNPDPEQHWLDCIEYSGTTSSVFPLDLVFFVAIYCFFFQ